MASDVDSELIGILQNLSLKTDAICKGWEYVLGLTATVEGVNYIIQSKKYIPFILSYIQQDKAEELLTLAFKCLINISNHENAVIEIFDTKNDFLEYLLHYICDGKIKFVQPMCYILSNISANPEFCQRIIDMLLASDDLLKTLMNMYCSNNPDIRSPYDFLTLVFANVSRIPAGRRLFLENTDFMNRISSFIKDNESEVRRLGVALILRNCCSEIDYHERLLENLSILPVLLLPLMDSTEYEDDEMDKLPIECQWLEESKVRDKNASVRRVLVQALIALCYSKKGWDFIQSHGAYYVVRDLHLWEPDDKVKDDIESLVSYLLVEEYSSPEGCEKSDGDDHLLIQQMEADIVQDLPAFVV